MPPPASTSGPLVTGGPGGPASRSSRRASCGVRGVVPVHRSERTSPPGALRTNHATGSPAGMPSRPQVAEEYGARTVSAELTWPR